MVTQFLHTKCHIPPLRTNSVARPRLREQLQSGLLAGRKLTLISAPAGYGKTTLAAAWVQQAALPIAWLSLDEQDNDFERFLAYLLLALQKTGDDAGSHLQAALDATQLPPLEEIAANLCHDLEEMGQAVDGKANGRFLLALDDYHKIHQPLIHDLLNLLLEHLPPVCRLLLISREDPPLPLPRLRVRGELMEIRAQDLRFTVAEAEQFFKQAMQLDLLPDWVAALETRTEGWVACLQLTALSLQGRNAAQTEAFIRDFGGSHRYVFDYLAEEVLGQQDAEVSQFLRQTAVLDSFNASLCQAITGRADSQAILLRLEQANLFLISLDDARHWFRYHPLFADYLRAGLDKPATATLYQKAAAWHEANDLAFEAVRYALASGDTDFAAAVIEQALRSDTTWSGGNVALLSSWLEALPPQALQSRPQLSLNASRIFYLTGRFELAEKQIALAEQSLRTLPETAETRQLLALAVLYRGSIAAVQGKTQQAIEQITFAQPGLSPENRLAHARAFFSLGLAYELAGQSEQALQNYLLASDEADAAEVLFLAVHARCAAAQVQITLGQLRLAEQTCQKACQLTEGEAIAPLGLAWIILGGIALERNDLTTTEQRLQDGIALARQGGLMDDVVLGLAFLARLYAAQGSTANAFAAVQEANSIIQTYGIRRMSDLVAAFITRLQLTTGQVQAAVQWAATYQSTRTAAPQEFSDLTLARFLLAQGELAQAAAIVAPVQQQSVAGGRLRTYMETLLLLALIEQAGDERETAVATLSQALQLAAPEGFLRLFLDEGQPLADLLPPARPAAPQFVDQLLAAFATELGETAVGSSSPDALSEQEMNVLRLLCHGLSNREIAAELFISPGTAKWHVHNILQKLDVANRAQAIIRARELGLVDR
ncbi:MAG: LuxR C-terminal-related transcriptional regulator [Chloroflexota bacterium]